MRRELAALRLEPDTTHQPFVLGLMSGLGKMFSTPVKVVQIQHKSRGADHDVFQVTWKS